MVQRLFTYNLIAFSRNQYRNPQCKFPLSCRVRVYINHLHVKLSGNVHGHQGLQHFITEAASGPAVQSEINRHKVLLFVRQFQRDKDRTPTPLYEDRDGFVPGQLFHHFVEMSGVLNLDVVYQ